MQNKSKFRMGIIGAGIFAEANHYPSLSLHFFDDMQRVAICDLDKQRADRLAGKYGWGKTYTDYNDMIDNEELDGVIVCVGGKYAPQVSIDVLKKGLPIFIEKPTSTYLEDTIKVAKAAKETGLIAQVGHQKRHGLAYKRAMDIVSNTQEFGNIIQIESKMHGFTVFPTFYTCMLEWQCHNLDIVRAFCGDIKEIEAKSLRNSESTGALSALLKFESGAIGILGWGTYGGPGQFSERIEMISDKGKGVIIKNACEVISYCEDSGEHWTHDWNPISKNQSHVFNGYVYEMLHFIDCVKNKKMPSPSIFDEEKSMKDLKTIADKAGIPYEWAPVGSAL